MNITAFAAQPLARAHAWHQYTADSRQCHRWLMCCNMRLTKPSRASCLWCWNCWPPCLRQIARPFPASNQVRIRNRDCPIPHMLCASLTLWAYVQKAQELPACGAGAAGVSASGRTQGPFQQATTGELKPRGSPSTIICCVQSTHPVSACQMQCAADMPLRGSGLRF